MTKILKYRQSMLLEVFIYKEGLIHSENAYLE